MKQIIFKSHYVSELMRDIKNGINVHMYSGEAVPISNSDTIQNIKIEAPESLKIIIPKTRNNYDVENAISLYESYKDLNRTQASDIRFWTYLSHTSYWKYLQKRWPLKNDEEINKRTILQHWFINGLSAKNLTRHGVSSLWWGSHATYVKDRKDPFELTKEFFSMLDYTRHLLSGNLGRNENYVHALLEFVVENPKLFSKFKEKKIRHIMRVMNFTAGYSLLGSLSKEEIKKLLKEQEKELLKIQAAK